MAPTRQTVEEALSGDSPARQGLSKHARKDSTPNLLIRNQTLYPDRATGGKKHRGGGRYGPGGRRGTWGQFPMGPGPFFPGKPKVGRGGVRIAILHLLTEEPMHGYQIIQEISERTDGVWNPSPGSVYPTLQQLADEGLVRAEERDGKNIFTITKDGAAMVASADQVPPWERMSGGMSDNLMGLREAGFQVGAAVMQIARAGSDDQTERAIEVLDDTRRGIYEIFAEDEQPRAEQPHDN